MTKKSPFFAKIHPNLFENDKFRNIPPQAFLDWVQILLHCVRNESDGFISFLAAEDIAEEISIRELLERNLLDRARFNKLLDVPEVLPDVLPRGVLTIEESREEKEENKKLFISGYLIHNYTDHQTSKAEIESRREIERKKSQARRNQARADANALLQASQKPSGDAKGWSSRA